MNQPVIEFSNFSFTYHNADSESLTGIDFIIRKGEFILLTGHSGCGKTTLTRCINGLIPDFSREIFQGNVVFAVWILQNMKQVSFHRWSVRYFKTHVLSFLHFMLKRKFHFQAKIWEHLWIKCRSNMKKRWTFYKFRACSERAFLTFPAAKSRR